ncbi:MAG TPA: flagellar biosynthetic protein FliO [Steroidobacteraceae bacterium]|jgi:flagellar protein FliO/FliZ
MRKIAPQKIPPLLLALSSYPTAVFANSDSADGAGIYSLLASLLLVLGAAAAATWLLRRWRGSVVRRDGPLQLVHVIALGPRERLALVKIGTRYLVVGITPTQITRVAELYDLQTPADDALGTGEGIPQTPRENA